MGSTFSNIQVHTHGRDSSALLEGVVALLYKTLRADGFLPAETEQSCDRSILLAVGSNWITIEHEEALARVEQALAPLLPSVEDWRRVVLNRQ